MSCPDTRSVRGCCESFDGGMKDDDRGQQQPAAKPARLQLHHSKLGSVHINVHQPAKNTPNMNLTGNRPFPLAIGSTSPSPNILDMPPEIVEEILTHLYHTDGRCGVGWTLYAKISTMKAAIPTWDENVRYTYRKCIGV